VRSVRPAEQRSQPAVAGRFAGSERFSVGVARCKPLSVSVAGSFAGPFAGSERLELAWIWLHHHVHHRSPAE
jgi:hypothetical protein